MESIEELKFPIGQYEPPSIIDAIVRNEWMDEIEKFPVQLSNFVAIFSNEELDKTYRPGGWTGRQVIHHIADSHMNSYIRFKWSLTEETPTIKAYDEKSWAELSEAKQGDVQLSLALIKALHDRWVSFLKGLNENDWQRKFYHPESETYVQLDYNLGIYAWHGKHHLAHLNLIKSQTK